MRTNICFAIVSLAIALTEAGPASKIIEKKSITEDTKLQIKKSDLEIEETGENKDRAKKSATTFCVQINPGSSQPTQLPCKENQAAIQNNPLTVQTQAVPQQVQTLSVVQPVVQVPQASILLPQPVVQPPSQPYDQSGPTVNIIQSVPQPNTVQPNSKPNSKPTPVLEAEIESIAEKPTSVFIEQGPQPLLESQESLTLLPIAPICDERMITIPADPLMLAPECQPQFATIVQVPSITACSNPFHDIISPCICQRKIVMLKKPSVEAMSMKLIPVTSYSSPFARSSMVMPHDSNMISHIAEQGKLESQSRSSTLVNVNIPVPADRPYRDYSNYKFYQKMFVPVNPYMTRDLVDDIYEPQTITINTYPQGYRGATSMLPPRYRSSENTFRNKENAWSNPVALKANNFQQTNKVPRAVDTTQLSPDKIKEIEEEKDQALLINGRRNTRTDKVEFKNEESQSTTN